MKDLWKVMALSLMLAATSSSAAEYSVSNRKVIDLADIDTSSFDVLLIANCFDPALGTLLEVDLELTVSSSLSASGQYLGSIFIPGTSATFDLSRFHSYGVVGPAGVEKDSALPPYLQPGFVFSANVGDSFVLDTVTESATTSWHPGPDPAFISSGLQPFLDSFNVTLDVNNGFHLTRDGGSIVVYASPEHQNAATQVVLETDSEFVAELLVRYRYQPVVPEPSGATLIVTGLISLVVRRLRPCRPSGTQDARR